MTQEQIDALYDKMYPGSSPGQQQIKVINGKYFITYEDGRSIFSFDINDYDIDRDDNGCPRWKPK